jgi:hypothetical protein
MSIPLPLVFQHPARLVSFGGGAVVRLIVVGANHGATVVAVGRTLGNGRHFRELDWVYTNDGNGMFYGKRPLRSEPDGTYGVALGDVDGDGALDAVVANDIGNRSVVYRNDGRGNFGLLASLGSYPAPCSRTSGARLGSAISIRTAISTSSAVGVSQDHIYLNERQGREWRELPFGTREPGVDARRTSVALGDIDRDGDLDVVLPGRYASHSLIYLNDGHAGFGESREFCAAADDMTAVALSDLNGDGYLDIAAVNWQQRHHILLNDGKGLFRPAGTFGETGDQAWSIASGDLDGDGDTDLIVGNSNVGYWSEDLTGDGRPDRGGNTRRQAPSRIYWNDGAGKMSAARR